MNENIDLTVLLKNVPRGTKFWSPLFGDVYFLLIQGPTFDYPVEVTSFEDEVQAFTSEGILTKTFPNAGCLLFPSKEQRDWNVWAEEQKKAHKVKVTLRPFDRVLVREGNNVWSIDFFSFIDTEGDLPFAVIGGDFSQCIPYNEETAHLVGTTDPCPIDYEIELSKDFVKSE